MRRESGQATVEWLGLVLLAALVLGGLATLRKPAREDASLGETLATRVTCAARDLCASSSETGARGEGRAGSTAGPIVAPPAAPPRSPAAAPRSSPAPAGRPRTRPARAPVPPARATDAFRRLRGVAGIARRAWIICLGYRRWRYEAAHPRLPTEPMPLDTALRIANACLNPFAFIGE